MRPREIFEYYSREDIQHALLSVAKNREVVGVFRNGNFDKRPNTIEYANDILAMVKRGAIEFHASLERWDNVMAIGKVGYERLRVGWDLVFDLDCESTEHGKIAVKAIVWALHEHGIKNIHVKFTGGTGFHIALPWESFPKQIDFKPTVEQYPELARKVVEYLKDFARERMEDMMLKKWSIEDIARDGKLAMGEFVTEDGIDPYAVVGIDTVLISPRHLFRMPYSLNRKTFLVSTPINPAGIDDLVPEQAKPSNIKAKMGYLDKYEEGEAELLFAETLDWFASRRNINEKKRVERERVVFKKAVSKNLFPPCIKNILNGLSDGRKRSLFILLNFLKSVKWDWEDIERSIWEWNQKNKPPLRDSYIRGQLRWHRAKKALPPPNCFSEGWYTEFGVCKPDDLCKTIKNPVSYPFRMMRKGKFKND